MDERDLAARQTHCHIRNHSAFRPRAWGIHIHTGLRRRCQSLHEDSSSRLGHTDSALHSGLSRPCHLLVFWQSRRCACWNFRRWFPSASPTGSHRDSCRLGVPLADNSHQPDGLERSALTSDAFRSNAAGSPWSILSNCARAPICCYHRHTSRSVDSATLHQARQKCRRDSPVSQPPPSGVRGDVRHHDNPLPFEMKAEMLNEFAPASCLHARSVSQTGIS